MMMKYNWIVGVCALAMTTILRAEEPPNEGRAVEGMLQRAASVLFRVPDGELLEFTKQYEYLKYNDGCEIARYKVQTEAGANVGDLVRLRVYPIGKSRVDLAMVTAEGKIAKVEPMQPVIVNGVALLDFAPSITGLNEDELAAGTAAGLSKMFAGLTYVEDFCSLPVAAPTAEQGRKLLAAMRMVKPALVAGSKIPAAISTDEAGRPFSTAALAGKPTVIFMGGVDDPDERAVMGWLQQYLAEHPNSFQLVEALQNTPASIAEYRALGGQTAGTVVPDLMGSLYDAFHTVCLPTLYLYDKSGQLVQMVEPPIQESIKEALAKLGR